MGFMTLAVILAQVLMFAPLAVWRKRTSQGWCQRKKLIAYLMRFDAFITSSLMMKVGRNLQQPMAVPCASGHNQTSVVSRRVGICVLPNVEIVAKSTCETIDRLVTTTQYSENWKSPGTAKDVCV